jgi:DNA-binding HxlR family transcriptional regulator
MTHKTFSCGIEALLDIISGKWKPLILFHLIDETKRFGELRKLMPGVTQKMLTNQLRELESDGLIRRKIHREVPPKVEYSLTEQGRSLEGMLSQMCQWGTHYMEHVVIKGRGES